MNPVRKNAPSGNLLRPGDNDAVATLFDHTRVEGRVALLVCGFAAIDLRRHDRVAEIDVVVTYELVKRDDVICEVLPAGPKHARNRRVTGEKGCHMIGGAPHQAEGRLRPGL